VPGPGLVLVPANRGRPLRSFPKDPADRWSELDQALSIAPRGAQPVTSKTDVTQRGTGLIEALHVTGPAAEYSGKLMLFGRFVAHGVSNGPGLIPAGSTAR
jgi:hypothetical protein